MTIKQLRHNAGLTQTQVAVQMRVAYQSYQAWEYGLHEPSLRHQMTMAQAFGVPLEMVSRAILGID